MASSMYKLAQTINSTKFRTDPFEDYYDVFEEIGSGQFATVYRVLEKHTGHEYAAKFIKKKRLETSRRGVAKADIQKEIYILAEIYISVQITLPGDSFRFTPRIVIFGF